MTETPHNRLQKSTLVYTESVGVIAFGIELERGRGGHDKCDGDG